MAGERFVFHGEYILLVVIGVIFFGLCTGLCAFTRRNSHDLWLLLVDLLKLRGDGVAPVEQATEADRIVFERAEKRRRDKEDRETALRDAADAAAGSDEEPLATGRDLEEGRSRTGSKASTASGTDSRTSQALVRHKGRRPSRASDPGVRARRLHEGDVADLASRSSSVAGARKIARVSPLPGALGDMEDALNLSDASEIAALADKQRKHAEKGRRHSVSTTTGADLMHLGQLASPMGGSLPLRGFHRPPPPSGAWKGTLMERTHKRTNKYQLRFLPDNQLVGSTQGPDGFGDISGTFDPSSKRVTWVERHPWGSVQASGHVFYTHHVAHITGSFTASDGGKGKLELSPEKS